jgi:integrase
VERTRREHGSGSVYYDSVRNRYRVLFDLGVGPDGKRRRISRYAASEGQAKRIARELGRRADDGDNLTADRVTVSKAVEDYLENGLDARLASSTRYQAKWLAGMFKDQCGARTLRELTVRDVERMLAELAEQGLGRRSLTLARATAARVLDHAVRLGWLPVGRNVAKLARLPEADGKRTRPVLTEEDVRALLHAARGDRLWPLLLLTASTGLRVGEVVALARDDLDVDTGVLTVRRAARVEPNGHLTMTAPKAKSGRRVLLPRELVDVLGEQRGRAAMEALALGIPSDFLFPSVLGTMVHPHNVRRWLRQVGQRASVPIVGVHDLRHAAASALADAGVPATRVAALLGHADVGVTVSTYTHPMPTPADAGVERARRLTTTSPAQG